MKKCAVTAAAAMFAAMMTPGLASVMTFEGVAKDTHASATVGSTWYGAYYFEHGFNLTTFGMRPQTVAVFGADYPNLNGDGSAVFGVCNEIVASCHSAIAISHWGALFDLVSFDASTLWLSDVLPPDGLSLLVRGLRHGHTFEVAVPLSQGVWQTFAPEDFTDLQWLLIQANVQGYGAEGDIALDNITLRYIPEPASIILLLTGMALIRRRRR